MPDNQDTDAIDELWTTLLGTAESSLVVTVGTTAIDPFRRTTRRLATVTRESYLYRWLTKEPDPEVIVIDLRETYTVGPIIRFIDAAITRVEPYWRESRVARILQRLERAGERAAETRLGEIVLRLLEPPEPPREKDVEDRD